MPNVKGKKKKTNLEPSSLELPFLCNRKFDGIGAGEDPHCLSTDMSDTDLKAVISSPPGYHLAG